LAELQIIGAPRSNFVWVTRIVLAEKGVPYENVVAFPHTPEVNAIHPLGKIPVMRHGDFTLCESRAICSYIDRTFAGPSLVPADTLIALKVEQWVSLICTAIDPVLIRQYLAAYIFPGTPDGSPNQAAIDKAMPAVEKQLHMLEGAVASGHLVGDTFTLADAYLFPILFYLSQTPETGAIIRRSGALSGFIARHVDRPSIRATKPPMLPAALEKLNKPAVAAAV
jgi:glutathione S-transferase